MKKLFKSITALVLTAAILSPFGDMPLSVSSTAYAAEITEEHVCDDHCGEELKSFELEEYAASTLKAPTASKKSGTISCTADSASIKLTAAKGATIYYSLNDSDYKKYTGAIKLTKNSTIETYAKIDGKKSKTVTYTYKLTPSVKFSATDTSSGKLVKLTTKVSGVKLYYTTDGSKPTTSSKLYTSSGITLTKSCQLRVLAVKSGWANASTSKNYTVNSSTGSSSSDTKQMGASSFTTPSTGNANIRYNGKNMAVNARYWSAIDDNKMIYDAVTITVSSDKSIELYIAQDQKFNTGDIIKSWKIGDERGDGVSSVSLVGFGLNADKYNETSYKDDVKFFDKVELKAVSIDYTGTSPSVLYFYILAHDENGNKTCIEGITKVTIDDSSNIALNSSGSGTGTSNSSSDTKQMGASSFTTPSTGNANIRYNGKNMAVNARYWSATDDTKMNYDAVTITVSDSKIIDLYIAQDQKFNTGDAIKSWKIGDEHGDGVSCVSLVGFELNADKNNMTSYREDVTFFDEVELKAISIDYTGTSPSVLYFYILAHDENGNNTCLEGITKVIIDKSSNIALNSSGSSGSTGNSGNSGNGSTGSGSSSSKTSYTSDITGNTFDIPDESRANISYDGTKKTVPAKFRENTPTKYWNYDTDLSVYLDGGTGNTSKEYILFNLTADSWKAGTTLELSDLKSDENSMSVGGIYRYYMQYVGSYSEHIFTKLNPSYFDDVRFTIIDTDSSGDVLKYYFYIKIHDSSSSHTIEGVVNVRKGVEPTPTADVGTGGGSGTTPSTPTTPTTPSLNICSTCFGTGNCNYCNGRRSCPVCFGKGGMSVPTYGMGGSGWVNCASCNGLRTCRKCGGTGKCQTCGGNRF